MVLIERTNNNVARARFYGPVTFKPYDYVSGEPLEVDERDAKAAVKSGLWRYVEEPKDDGKPQSDGAAETPNDEPTDGGQEDTGDEPADPPADDTANEPKTDDGKPDEPADEPKTEEPTAPKKASRVKGK